MPFVKLCGMRSLADVTAAATAGADYIGLVINYARSRRSLTVSEAADLAVASSTPVVAVVVDQTLAQLLEISSRVRPSAFQLAGSEPADLTRELRRKLPGVAIWKVLHLTVEADQGEADLTIAAAKAYLAEAADEIMLDARVGSRPGGTGESVDWATVRRIGTALGRPMILAGGLNADNVGRAIEEANPLGVDVSSGVETSSGRKDAGRMMSFTSEARRAFAKQSTAAP